MEFPFSPQNFGDPQQRLLRGIPAFARLPEEAREKLGSELRAETFPPQAVILEEGEAADRIFLIEEGDVEVSIRTEEGRAPVSRLADGEMFGEIGLLLPAHRRTARVTALSAVHASTLLNRTVMEVLEGHRDARAILEEAADQALVRSFVKGMRPFEKLTVERLRFLSERLRELEFEAGETIVRQGEPGDTVYLIRAGMVDVVRVEPSGERRADRMDAGEIIGESALLTSTPRDASLVAVEKTKLLALGRQDLIEVLDKDRRVAEYVVLLMRERDRPTGKAGIVLQPRPTATGSTIWVLADPKRLGVYHELSSLGLFVWNRLDGTRTASEIAERYRTERGAVATEEIARIMAELVDAGFASAKQLDEEMAIVAGPPLPWWRKWWKRLALALKSRSQA